MPASNYAINKVLNNVFGATSASVPATMYFGLSTEVMTAATLGTLSTEPATAMGYARKSATNDHTTWTTSTVQTLASDIAIVFDASTDVWGLIRAVFIADSGTRAAGNIWWYYNFSPAFEVGDSTQITLASGTIVATMT